MTSRNSDGLENPDAKRPSSTSELGRRIGTIVSLYATKKEAAHVADVSPEHLARYVKGQVAPPFEVLMRLAAAKGVSLDWLASGRGEMLGSAVPASAAEPSRTEPDEELMRAIGNGVDTVYREFGARLGPGDIARLAERVRVDVVNSGARTTDEKQVAMRVSLDHLRRELRQPAANTDKGSACS